MGLITLNKIFASNYFEIPDYQRGYSWESPQVEDLINDIENLRNKNHLHYTGTLVVASSEEGGNTYQIIDGQQRLTTIIIILSSIYHSDPNKYENIYELFMRRGEVGNRRLVLTPNKDSEKTFAKIVIDNNEANAMEIKADINIQNAKTIILKWIKKRKGELDLYLSIITHKLGFIFYATVDDKEIGIMFEVINNRGKELSELEKIKNYFIYYASIYDFHELRKTINDQWINIQINLSKAYKTSNVDEGGFILYNYLVFYSPEKLNINEVYHKIKERYNPNRRNTLLAKNHAQEINEFINFLSLSSKNYAYFFNEYFFQSNYTGELKHEFGEALKLLRCQETYASIMPLILSVMARVKEKELLIEVLKLIEKVNFRLYILKGIMSRADAKKADFYHWANRLYKEYDWMGEAITIYSEKKITGTSLELLNAELIQITKYYCNNENFINSLRLTEDENFSFYNWSGLRFFLANYENYLQKSKRKTWDIQQILLSKKDKKNQSNDVYSKEHIWAEDNLKVYYKWHHLEKNRLGNFILLGSGDNSSLSNKDILEKFSDLNNWIQKNRAGTDLSQVNELPEVLVSAEIYLRRKKNLRKRTHGYYRKLAQKINDIRETKLITFALKRWALPSEKLEMVEEINTY